jgi:hypothetical protein
VIDYVTLLGAEQVDRLVHALDDHATRIEAAVTRHAEVIEGQA